MKLCSVAGCGTKHYARSFCKAHYTQIQRHGRLTPEREHGRPLGPCAAPACEVLGSRYVRGYEAGRLCERHARQIRKHGRLTPELEHVLGHHGCSVAGCQNPHSAKGFCANHYNSANWARIARQLKRAGGLDA